MREDQLYHYEVQELVETTAEAMLWTLQSGAIRDPKAALRQHLETFLEEARAIELQGALRQQWTSEEAQHH